MPDLRRRIAALALTTDAAAAAAGVSRQALSQMFGGQLRMTSEQRAGVLAALRRRALELLMAATSELADQEAETNG
jgi:hypothetical protein